MPVPRGALPRRATGPVAFDPWKHRQGLTDAAIQTTYTKAGRAPQLQPNAIVAEDRGVGLLAEPKPSSRFKLGFQTTTSIASVPQESSGVWNASGAGPRGAVE